MKKIITPPPLPVHFQNEEAGISVQVQAGSHGGLEINMQISPRAVEREDDSPEFVDYPCLHDLVWQAEGSDILKAVANEEKDHPERITQIIDQVNKIRLTDVGDMAGRGEICVAMANGIPYYISDVNRDWETFVKLPISVTKDTGEYPDAASLIANILDARMSVAAIDQPDPQADVEGTGILAEKYKEIKTSLLARAAGGILPTSGELQVLNMYRDLSAASHTLGRYLHQKNYECLLENAVDVSSYRISTLTDEDLLERVTFIEGTLASMSPDIKRHNAVIMMLVTSPASPVPGGVSILKYLFERYLDRPGGVAEKHFLVGFDEDNVDDSRAVLYIYALTTITKEEVEE